MDQFGSALIAGLASGSVLSLVLGFLTLRREHTVKSEIDDRFRRLVETRESQWALLQEALGPICAHLSRTKMAMGRWREPNLYLETQIAESNAEIRRLLLAKYHLLTPELRGTAMELVKHYDVWSDEYHKLRESIEPGVPAAPFVFVGPKGFGFPPHADKQFTDALDLSYAHLIGTVTDAPPREQHREPAATGAFRSRGLD